jgi:hypothetical protein
VQNQLSFQYWIEIFLMIKFSLFKRNVCRAFAIQGDSEISLEKKTVIGEDEKKSLTKKLSYKSFFVFEIQMIENLVKIASTLLS